MNDSIDKYLNKSKNNLNTIISNLETNIEFLDNELWNSYEEISDKVHSIVDIYFDKYYLYTSKDYSKIDKYIKFNNKINRKLKTILLSIIDYYESCNEQEIISKKESSILYLTILIYVALTLYEKKFSLIDTPKKIEKVINNIIDNFARIRFKKEKDLVALINEIKSIVEENNKFNEIINNLSTNENHNTFTSINKDNIFYKVMYEYDIKSLKDYEDKDLLIVNNKMNMNRILTKISYDLCYFTVFKLMKSGIDYKMLFPVSKKDLIDDETRRYFTERNEVINNNIKFLIDYNEIINDYEFVNLIKSLDINIYIEIVDAIETNSYNMFMDNNHIVVPEEFLSINEKYVEIWKDMKMDFIIKNLGERLLEKSLISRK